MMNERCSITTFIGSTPNIGTTLIAFSSALRLAEKSNKRVLFVCFNLKSSKLHRYLGLSEYISLDHLVPDLRGDQLTLNKLKLVLHQLQTNSNFYILFGNKARETAEYYGVEELSQLLHVAAKEFDYIIVDCSAYWDNAGTITALIEADSIVVTTTNALSHFQEDYDAWFGTMSRHLPIETKNLYFTMIKQRRGLYQIKECYKRLRGTALAEVEIPNSLYDALDSGELNIWLSESSEGSKWLATFISPLFPEIEIENTLQNVESDALQHKPKSFLRKILGT